ncbi:MAG: response regulator transcription factor [Coprobacillaceae bacterium]
MYRILLIEDEKLVRDFIVSYFSNRNMDVIEAKDGYEALEKIQKSYDLILLDIMMPGIDGYEVCKQIRFHKDTPIIFISALSQDDNQLKAYELGADDYITKPFKPSLLYAKCIALIKRDKIAYNNQMVGKLQINKTYQQIHIENTWVQLTHKEYQVLEYLIKHEGILLSREQILNSIWGYDYYGDARAVDTYVKKLRKKLGKYQYIQTIIGSGYIFDTRRENHYEV